MRRLSTRRHQIDANQTLAEGCWHETSTPTRPLAKLAEGGGGERVEKAPRGQAPRKWLRTPSRRKPACNAGPG